MAPQPKKVTNAEILEKLNQLDTDFSKNFQEQARVNTEFTLSIREQKIMNLDILEAIHSLASYVDDRFNRVEIDITELKKEVSGLTTDMTSVKSQLLSVNNQMVTKDYLDRKLFEWMEQHELKYHT